MKTLTYKKQTTPIPGVIVTAFMTLKSGREMYLCNPMDELTEAMDTGQPFKAHTVVGMEPNEAIINPAHVATIEAT